MRTTVLWGLVVALAAIGCGGDCLDECVECNDDNVSDAEIRAFCERACEVDACADLIGCLADNACIDDDIDQCPGSCRDVD